MFQTLKKACGRTGLVFIETVLVLGVVLVLVLGGFVWRLTSAPLDLEFARSTIEEALYDEERGVRVKSEKIVLHWPELRGPLLLGLQGGAIVNEAGDIVLSIEEVALGLNKRQLFFGRVAPEVLVLKKPSLSVTRLKDNSFDIGLAGEAQPSEDEDDSDFISSVLALLEDSHEGQASPLAKLKRFEIDDAALVIEDQVLDLTWQAITADVAFMPVAQGLSADLALRLPKEDGEKAPVFSAQAVLDKHSKHVELAGSLDDFRPAMLAQKIPELDLLKHHSGVMNATFKTVLNQDLMPRIFDLDLRSAEGAVQHEELGAEPQSYKNLEIDIRYDEEKASLALPKVGVSLNDIPVNANAEFSTADNKINGSFRIEIDSARQDVIDPLWPEGLKDENAYEWIVEKLSEGTFSDLYAQGDLLVEKAENGWNFDPEKNIQNVSTGFSFEGMSVNYRAPLAGVTNAKGSGEFLLDQEKLRIDIESANVLDMEIPSAELEFYNIIEEGKGTADVSIKLNGSLQSALQYISAEPLAVKPDFDVPNTQGQVSLQINLGFPTSDIDLEDFDIDIKGTAANATIPRVVKDLTLTGGPFELDINNEKLEITGDGQIEGRSVRVGYEEFISSKGKPYSSKVKASLNVDAALRKRFGMDLSSFLDGAARVDLVYTGFGGGRSEVDVTADLTQSKLFVEPFDYVKPVGVKGRTTLKAILKDGDLKEIVDLKGQARDLKLQNSRLFFRQRAGETELASGVVSQFSLGETASSVRFEIANSGSLKLRMEGQSLDLRPFLAGDDKDDKSYDSPPMQLSVAVNKMRTADDALVRNGKIFADIDVQGKFNQLEMDAIAGAGAIYLRYKPDAAGKRVFRFEADDAGAALKAFDLYDNIRGGKMVIYGEPIRGVYDRNLIGRAELTDFRVVDAPTLARLLGAMSLPGLTQTLDGEGLVFTKLESDFDWLYRPQGSLLVLKDGRTSGNSLGLTFDGTFDNARNTIDVKGTIIPLSGVNAAIGNIPLLGDILTGGTGALIAATYTMKGEGAQADVSVNPLSALTPGFLRRILFEN